MGVIGDGYRAFIRAAVVVAVDFEACLAIETSRCLISPAER